MTQRWGDGEMGRWGERIKVPMGAALGFTVLVGFSAAISAEYSEAWTKFESEVRSRESQIRTVQGNLRVMILNTRTKRRQDLYGRFWVRRPDEITVIYEEPSPQTVVSRGNLTILYQPEINQVTRITGRTKPVFVDLYTGFAGLFDRGQITDVEMGNGFYRVWVTRDGEAMELTVDEESLLPRSLLQVSDEHRTRVEFKNLKQNVKIDSKIFEFHPPEGAEIIEMEGE